MHHTPPAEALSVHPATVADLDSVVALERLAFRDGASRPWSRPQIAQELALAQATGAGNEPRGAVAWVVRQPIDQDSGSSRSDRGKAASGNPASGNPAPGRPAADNPGSADSGPGSRSHRIDEAVVGWSCFRLIAGEAELLRIAVDPTRRRAGIGRSLADSGLNDLGRRGVTHCHLEVAADNQGALALYLQLGFRETGRRPGYYAAARQGVDAVLLSRPLRRRCDPNDRSRPRETHST